MNYRRFGRLDFDVSALGFGCMRLPVLGGDYNAIDESLAIEMIRHAIDRGINYIDTAYPYHGGNSEGVVGKALRDGYRARVKLATKLPSWAVNEPADFDRFLNEQCERLQVDFIDFYLVHNLQALFWPQVRDLGVLDWLDRVKAEGRIGEVGFSYHHDYDLFTEIVDAYDWCFCQIQYNYMNEEVQAGTKGLLYAAEKDLAVIVMEPLLGGALANPPDKIREIFSEAPIRRTPADWALRWLWDKPEIATVLSGMSTMEQVEENLESVRRAELYSLADDELALIDRVRDAYERQRVVPCTKCGYCLPCPAGVDIPFNLQLYNDALVFGGNQKGLNQALYLGLSSEAKAAACDACHACEENCPQAIPISEWMPRVRERFER